ncbi:efflux RND transporter periplasmic adaptor subunit [Crenobacter intestini]|uniref:Efflux RND transporter periplasmic adaptor subunit n=1 Tax=Crenobacter intestini TaxID=2563443 RepID=A0A4T0ULT1_9NEIS|nr:efflux RND transporter periplasmic adaptor subunit [Crenobacter intestini]TIC79205.1 efflux RND transporter periplasmic adaptor subunit [Crenobacter intestini]
MSRRRLLYIALTLVLLAAAAWFVLPRVLYGPLLTVERLAARPLTLTVVASGRVAGQSESALGATLTARVRATPVEEGARVAAGSLLLSLESDEVAAQLAQAGAAAEEAAATQAEADRQYARQQGLFAQGFISRAALDAEDKKVRLARARAGAAQGSVAAAQARLSQLSVRAPHDGVLLARDVEVGDLVTAGKPVLLFAAGAGREIRLDVDERYLARLSPGQRARVAADARPDAPFDAKLTKIAPRVDAERGTVEVTLVPDAPPAFLTHNMTVSAEVVAARKGSALTVPAGALRDGAGGRHALRLASGRVEVVPVRTGVEADGRVEVLSGLAPGDLLVLPGQDAAPGMRARARASR